MSSRTDYCNGRHPTDQVWCLKGVDHRGPHRANVSINGALQTVWWSQADPEEEIPIEELTVEELFDRLR